MLILAIDTSTSAITVAVHDGSAVLAEVSTVDPRAHGEHLAPNLKTVLERSGRRPADITEVVVGVGPGPFTGLRVGLVTARTVGFVQGVPVSGVCSLDAIAWEAHRLGRQTLGPGAPVSPVAAEAPLAAAEGPEAAVQNSPDPAVPTVDGLVIATDARRKEVYWARYEPAGSWLRRVHGPAVGRPEAVSAELVRAGRHGRPPLPIAGRGPLLYPALLAPACAPLDVSAAALAEVALQHRRDGIALLPPEPLYLRRPDAAELSSRATAPAMAGAAS